MAKQKKAAKKSDPDLEMIHFRPGAELGKLIGEFALEADVSRGEAAKRLTALAIRGFDVEFYDAALRLLQYLYGTPSFDEACDHLHVAVVQEAATANVDVADLPREQKLRAADELVAHYRLMRGFEDEVKEKRVSIKLYRS